MIGLSRGSHRVMRRLLNAVAGALSLGCRGPVDGIVATSDLVTLYGSGGGGRRTLRLEAAPGVRINARLPPTLEWRDGQRVTFTTDSITTDSSYFSASPGATIDARHGTRGTLRASVCPASGRVCVSVRLNIAVR